MVGKLLFEASLDVRSQIALPAELVSYCSRLGLIKRQGLFWGWRDKACKVVGKPEVQLPGSPLTLLPGDTGWQQPAAAGLCAMHERV